MNYNGLKSSRVIGNTYMKSIQMNKSKPGSPRISFNKIKNYFRQLMKYL